MRHSLLLILLISQSVWADYLSIGKSNLQEDKVIILNNDQEIHVKKGDVIFKYKDTFADLIDSNSAESYGVEKIVLQEGSLPVNLNIYNFIYLLKNTVEDKNFILRINNKDLLITTNRLHIKISSPLYLQKVDAIKYSYEKLHELDGQGKLFDSDYKIIMSKYVDQSSNLFALQILDGEELKVKKIENVDLINFFKEKEKRDVKVDEFDFSKDKIYLGYLSQNKSSQQRMNVTYSMEKKNIKSVVEFPISMLDPEKKTSQVAKHIGFLRDLNSKELFALNTSSSFET